MLSKYHYYPGLIFNAYTYGIGVPIVKGGRYNDLLHKFGKDAAAIGFAVVIDDLLEALNRQKVAEVVSDEVEVIYYTKKDYQEKLSAAIAKRNAGAKVSLIPKEV